MKTIIKNVIELIKVDLQKDTPHYAYELIRNPNCPVEILKYFAEQPPHESHQVHGLVVSNPNCPKHLMMQVFFKIKTVEVCLELASNPRCPPELMWELFIRSDEDVYTELLRNPYCSVKVLQAFYMCDIKWAKIAALNHRNASLWMLKSGAKSIDTDIHLAVAATASDKITPEILATIVHHSADADCFVIENPKCPVELMHKILSRGEVAKTVNELF